MKPSLVVGTSSQDVLPGETEAMNKGRGVGCMNSALSLYFPLAHLRGCSPKKRGGASGRQGQWLKYVGSGIKPPGSSPGSTSWTIYLASLCLSFDICKVGVMSCEEIHSDPVEQDPACGVYPKRVSYPHSISFFLPVP